MGPDVTAVVGGQFGSEGKGLIVGKIATEFGIHVRVGAANAGHTLWTEKSAYRVAIVDEGDHRRDRPLENTHEKHVMRQLPCAAYANPDARLYIGPGALVSPGVLNAEIEDNLRWRQREDHAIPVPIFVDPRAHVITQSQIEEERMSGLVERVGSTSATAREGVGKAQADRIMRESRCVLMGDYAADGTATYDLANVPDHLALSHDPILLEGTQGYGLSITTGEHPYITSRNTTAAGLLADCGVAPNRLERVIVVCRTYPIRVAGNSGPFHPHSTEIEWNDIGVDPSTEMTTVTKKVRRVATFSLEQVVEACLVNGATEVALTFANYIDNRLAGADSSKSGIWTSLKAYPGLESMVDSIEYYAQVPVTMLGTGPKSVVMLDRGR